MAVSSTVCGALLVENGQKHQRQRSLRQPAMAVVQHRGHGELAGRRRADRGPVAAPARCTPRPAIAAVAPIAVIAELPCTGRRSARTASIWRNCDARCEGFSIRFRSRTLWLIAAFLFCYYFSPGFGTPLYFHMTDHLRFSQGYHRHAVVGQRRRLDRRRPALPLAAARHDARARCSTSASWSARSATLAFLLHGR